MIAKPILAAAMVAMMAAPVAAQNGDQALIDNFYANWNEGDTRSLGWHLAECVAERHPVAADSFVRNKADPLAIQKDRERLIDGKCVKQYWFRSSQTSIEPSIYKPMLAEALLTMSYPKNGLPAVAAVVGPNDRPRPPDVASSNIHPYYRDMFALDRMGTRLAEMSECVVRAQSEAVLALTATEMGSREEAVGLEELEANAPQCATTTPGARFPSFVRRGALMMELYELTRRAGGPVPRGKS